MKTRKLLAIVLSLVMVLSLCGTAFAYHLTDEITELETNNSDRSMEIATQAYTLLVNNGVLPLKGEKKIASTATHSIHRSRVGTGSGAVKTD
jgi:protein involved in sex pheromone biosynthesis